MTDALAVADEVLILAPTGRNADSAAALLERDGITARICASLDELCGGLGDAAGAAIIEEEAVAAPRHRERLAECLGRQPPWSDLPFIVLTRGTLAARRELPLLRLPESLGNVMFLERPLHAFTLASAVRTALRARRRQWQVRDHLVERERTAAELRLLNETLEIRVEQRTAERDRLWALSEDLLVLADAEGRLLRVSPSWPRLLGHTETALLSRPYWEVIHADDRPMVMCALDDMRTTGRPIRFEHRLMAADGSWRWLAWTWSPEAGGARLYGVGRNITAEKEQSEALARAEEQLRQAQKMEAVGQLTGGIAHDFNNLLTGVLGNLELLEFRLKDEADRKLVQAATRSALRGAKLTHQLLAFSRKQHLTLQATDLNLAVSGMIEMLRRTLGEAAVEVRAILAPDLWPAMVDATQIEVAILNLAINARDAMPVGGTVMIETRNVADATQRPAELAAGDYVVLSVSDTGEGMAPEVLAKAFEPFFTTKEIGKGTGLGLSQVYGLAQQSGGTARIRSRRGEGTTVEIFLRRAEAQEGEERTPGSSEPRTRRPWTVLLVDDQEEVREVAAALLVALGYRCIPAASGPLAIDLLAGTAGIDVLLVDYAMPAMIGTDVIAAARHARPDLAVVLMTGYANTDALGERLQGVELLKKPFRRQELAAALEGALRRRRRVAGGGNVVRLEPPRR